ncbi:MAG TPA: CDP-alcohol phosphatidyltransferase family protein [Actinomycetota bacterium]|nr:CDP-alcohol phosphatidyltransferase family protein [Actinomycetota bacterium]
MLDSKARDALSGVSRAVGSAVGRSRISPNLITTAGLVVTGAASILVLRDGFVAAGIVLLAGGALDFVDGSVARATGKATSFGAVYDSIADRMSDGLILGSLTWALFDRGDGVGAALGIVSLVLSGLVPYIRAKAESLGYDASVGVAERAERVIAIVAGLVFGIITPVLGVLAALSAVTVVQRAVHVGKQARARG